MCTVILALFTSLPKSEKEYINKLRDFRNNLMAHPAKVSMDEPEFETAWRELASTLIVMSKQLDCQVHNKCQQIVKDFRTCPLDTESANERLHKLTQSDEFIEKQLGNLDEGIKDLATKVDRNTEAIEDLKQTLMASIEQGRDFRHFQVFGAEMGLKGPDKRLTSLAEITIKTVFEEALSQLGVRHVTGLTEEDISNLTMIVNKMLEMIKSNGGQVRNVETKCIVIEMGCKSCRDMLRLINYLESDEFAQLLGEMALTLKAVFGCAFHITFEVTQASLKAILHSLCKQD